MSKTNGILAVCAALIGGGCALLYVRNGSLEGKIRGNAEQCEQQTATLRQRYQAEIDDLRRYLLEQYNRKPDTVAREEKPGFNQLISSGHRMQAIGSKYEFLLESALLDAEGKRQLRKLLYQWERLTDSIRADKAASGAVPRQLQAELDDTDARIRALLTDPLDYQHFVTHRQRDL